MTDNPIQIQSLQQIRQELLDSQLKVASLQDMSLQLLVNSQGSDCLEAKEKVHVIGNRLKLLLKEVTRDLRELAKILDITSSQQVEARSLCSATCRGVAPVTCRTLGVTLTLFPHSPVRIYRLGRPPMTWTRPAPSVPYQEGVRRVGDDR